MDGATGYNLEYGWNGKDFHPLVNLPASLTQYEDFTALPNVTRNYRLQPVTAAGTGDWLRADAMTPVAAPHPITVIPTYDNARTVNATIGKAGGSISLTDAGGVKYKLDIPQAALTKDTQIQLIPLIGMDGWPLDGERLAAVMIEPRDLQLAEVATLSITLRSAGKPALATVGFAFQPSGAEFHLQPLPSNQPGKSSMSAPGGQPAKVALQTAHVITLPVIELTVLGVGQGSTSAITDLAKNDAPTDPGAAADQQQAAANASQDDLMPLVNNNPPPNTGNPAAVREEKEVVQIWEQIQQATTGDQLDAAMQQFQKWQDASRGLADDAKKSLVETTLEDTASQFKKMLDKAAQDCKKSSVNSPPYGIGPLQGMLQNTMSPPSSGSVWDQLQNKMTSEYGDNVLNEAWSNLKQGVCGNFIVYKPAGSSGTICSLSRHFTIEESAPLVNITIDFYPISMTMGAVYVHEEFKAARGVFDGTGNYDLEFYTPKEANIQVSWAGHYVQPGMNIPNAVQKPLHYDLKNVIATDCP